MEEHPNFHDPIRLLVEKRYGSPIRDAEWFRLLADGYWPQDARIAFPGDERAQVEFLVQTIRMFRASGYFSFGRAPARRRPSPSERVLALSPDESAMAAAVSEAMFARAATLPGVKYVHKTMGMRRTVAEQFWSDPEAPIPPGLIEHVVSLAIRFGWDPEYAALFAFAGVTPLGEPLRASISVIDFPDEYDPSQIRSRGRLLLDADPWISEATLLKAFRALRKELIGSDQHLPTPRQLEVFRFVLRRLDDRGQPRKDPANPRGSWQGIGRQWNEEHKGDGWAYGRPDHIKTVFDAVNAKLVARRIVLSGEDEISLEARASGREHGKRYLSYVDPRHRTPRDSRSKNAASRAPVSAMEANTPTDTPTPTNTAEQS